MEDNPSNRPDHAEVAFHPPLPVGSWRFERTGWWWSIRLELVFVEGRSAYELARRTDDDVTFGRVAARRIGEVVQRLAAAGVMHRDLKLENVLIAGPDDDPRIWILDPIGVRTIRNRPEATVRMLDRIYIEVCDRVIPRWARIPLVRAAVEGLPRPERRAVLRRVRAIHYG